MDNHYYSVPYRHIGQRVEVRLTGSIIEVFLDGLRIALHQRSYEKGKATTLKEHMPKAHHLTINVSRENLISKAEKIGPICAECVAVIMDKMPRPEMAFRGCQGIIRMASQFGKERLEKACKRALEQDDCRYRSIYSMLKNNLEDLYLPVNQIKVRNHPNLRGRNYYSKRSEVC